MAILTRLSLENIQRRMAAQQGSNDMSNFWNGLTEAERLLSLQRTVEEYKQSAKAPKAK